MLLRLLHLRHKDDEYLFLLFSQAKTHISHSFFTSLRLGPQLFFPALLCFMENWRRSSLLTSSYSRLICESYAMVGLLPIMFS